jgi:hypothetical protein
MGVAGKLFKGWENECKAQGQTPGAKKEDPPCPAEAFFDW